MRCQYLLMEPTFINHDLKINIDIFSTSKIVGFFLFFFFFSLFHFNSSLFSFLFNFFNLAHWIDQFFIFVLWRSFHFRNCFILKYEQYQTYRYFDQLAQYSYSILNKVILNRVHRIYIWLYLLQSKIVYQISLEEIMSYVTYNPNQTVYVKNIGYGILINCGELKSISRKVSNVNVKKQSIYFDPEMFNTHSSSDESNKSQKSHSQEKPISKQKIQQQKQSKPQKQQQKQMKEKQILKEIKQVINSTSTSPVKNNNLSSQQERVNLVCVKLQGMNNANSGVKIYAPDHLITKTIDLIIKPMMDATREQIVVSIQISKTIENLKKLIFSQLNLLMANFFNVRLMSMNPVPTDLSNNAFKISQYFLKDCAKLVLVADYAFSFNPINPEKASTGKFALSNNSYTLNSYKVNQKIQEINKQPINTQPIKQLSPTKHKSQSLIATIENIVQNVQIDVQPKVQQIKEPQLQVQPLVVDLKIQQNINQNLNILPKIQEKTKSQTSNAEHSSITLSCAILIESSRYYWQFKIDKLPNIEDDYAIGLFWQNLSKEKKQTTYWQYNILNKKKEVIIQYDDNQLIPQYIQEDYGLPIKNGDVIGVQVSIKKGCAYVTFYKFSNLVLVNLGVCHEIQMKDKHIKRLTPFVTLGGQSQITLDSRANFPLDSYRNT